MASLRRARHTSLFPPGVAAAAASDAAAAATTDAELQLPPREDLGRWLTALMQRDGADVVARAMIACCPRSDLMLITEILCHHLFGPEQLDGEGVQCFHMCSCQGCISQHLISHC